jgi:hypothetical protein
MNTNAPTPDPLPPHDPAALNAAITNRLRSYRWLGQALAVAALSVGLLAIVAGILLGWASLYQVMPMERLLLQDYPSAQPASGLKPPAAGNDKANPSLTREELDWRHVQVTAAHGKALVIAAVAVVLLGTGTFLTLLLVIVNRHATLRHISANLEQISLQLRESPREKRE